MKIDIDLWKEVQPHWWKWTRRQQPAFNTIDGIIWHATRSGLAYGSLTAPYGAPWTVGWELTATLNWFRSVHNGNQGNGVAGMSNYLIGDGKVVRVMPDEFVPRYSAGAHDFRGLSIEVCQPRNDEPYDPRDIALCHEVAEELSTTHGFALGRIPYVDFANTGWPGEVGHEDTAQGRAQGKSDPGPLFWQAYEEDDDMTPEQVEKIVNERLDAVLPTYYRTLTRAYWDRNVDGAYTDPPAPEVVAGIALAALPDHTHDMPEQAAQTGGVTR